MISELKKRYPWPESKPDLPFDNHGWFGWFHKAMMDVVLPSDANVIIEMGSWLGLSTRFMLSQTPATIIAIDHWKGDKSIFSATDDEINNKIPTLYEAFLSNCWEYRERLVPMKTTTITGLQELHDLGIKPDFIYLDASHQYEDAKADLDEVWRLFPDVRLGGDDYGGKWDGVKRAVDEHTERAGRILCLSENAWTIARIEEKDTIEKSLKTAMMFRYEEMDMAAEAMRHKEIDMAAEAMYNEEMDIVAEAIYNEEMNMTAEAMQTNVIKTSEEEKKT